MTRTLLYDLNHQTQWRALLLVHPSIARLEREMDEIGGKYLFPVINVSHQISEQLFDVTHDEQIRMVQPAFQDMCRQAGQGPVILHRIAILFEPILHLDPFRLIVATANLTRLVVLWSGDYSGVQLTYAVPQHNHYRAWTVNNPDIRICRLT